VWRAFLRIVVLVFVIGLFLGISISPRAQIQIGTVKGTISDLVGALLRAVGATLANTLTGYSTTTSAGTQGEFIFDNVSFGYCVLRADAVGFRSSALSIGVRSNLPVNVDLRLGAVFCAPYSQNRNAVASGRRNAALDDRCHGPRYSADRALVELDPTLPRCGSDCMTALIGLEATE
jgi:hypothetical protein